MGKKNLGGRLNQVFLGLAELLGVEDQVVVVNTMPYVNIIMMLGGFLSRRLGIIFPGRTILIWGTRLAFPGLVGLVKTVKIKMIIWGWRLIILLAGTTAVTPNTLVPAHLYLNTKRIPILASWTTTCDMSFDYSGYPLYLGRDQHDNQVYTLGLGRLVEVGCRAIHDFKQIIRIEPSQLLVKEIRIPSELDIWAASKASRIPLGLGSIINRLVSDYVIAREFHLIKIEAGRLHQEVSFLQGARNAWNKLS